LTELEAHSGGRLGVFALDTGSGRSLAHRASERFPMCSTFKLLAVSAVLARVDRRAERLDRRIPYGTHDLLSYAPVTTLHVHAGSMSVGALCAATIELSDNTAANLLLRDLGGPPEVTRFARILGDPSTRLDRNEPTVNTAIPGDIRDTTTPHAMARDLRVLVTGSALSRHSRTLLAGWLAYAQTGTTRLRAGLPFGWRAGDKTGSGDNGTANDIAVIYPPGRAPVIVTAYLTGATVSSASRDTLLANVGRVVSRTFAASPGRAPQASGLRRA
jgi:beta-lactamase class A